MKRLMAHLVAGYPNIDTTKSMVGEILARDIAAIELQIPFSDPIADGPVLMAANDRAVQNGVSVEQVLRLIRPAKTQFFVMSYLQPILHYGPNTFFDKALRAGCAGFIIPDLPFDVPEVKAFIADQPELQQAIIPVLSPGMKKDRLNELFNILSPKLIYVTARHGITGERTEFTNALEKTVQHIRMLTKADLAVGFGIQTPDDVRVVLKNADLAVVGSAFTAALNQSQQQAENFLDRLCKVA